MNVLGILEDEKKRRDDLLVEVNKINIDLKNILEKSCLSVSDIKLLIISLNNQYEKEGFTEIKRNIVGIVKFLTDFSEKITFKEAEIEMWVRR